jgi:hypothetical protein
MAHYPAWPGSQSFMRVACIFNHSTVGSGDFVSANFTIHDFSNVIYHNGAARTITNQANIPGASGSFVAPDCTGLVGAAPNNWVNRSITRVGTGTGNIKAYTAVKSFVTTVAPACTVTLNQNTGAGTILAGTTFKIEDSDVRAVNDATVDAVPPAAANVTSAQANFIAGDVGCSISGSNFVDGTTISAVVSATQANTTPAPIATVTQPLPNASQVVTICGTKEVATARTVVDANQLGGGTQVTTASARFGALSAVPGAVTTADVGLRVSTTVGQPGVITQPCYITSRVSAATVNVGPGACAAGLVANSTVTIGEPSATAPVDGDPVLQQGTQLPLDPGLVSGSAACEQDEMAGFGITGLWRNPGNYAPPGLLLLAQPSNMKTVAQILFHTSVIDFAAYIVEVPALTDPLITATHYNIVFTGTPVSAAVCASTATSPGLGLSIGINAVTPGVSALPAGQGRPGTAQVRSTRASTTGSTNTIFITDDLGGAGVKWVGPDYQRLCPVPAGKPDINSPNGFICGAG